MAALRKWWSKKYGLPPNHDLFLDRPVEEYNQEMMEDLLLQRDELLRDIEEIPERERQRTRKEIILEHLNLVNKALGLEVVVQDPLWVHWEAQLAQGIEPDLDLTVEDLELMSEH